jgi:hypothetical protein
MEQEMTNFEKCLEIAIRFHPKIKEKMMFLFIGPRNQMQYQNYINYVMGLPSPSFTALLADSSVSQRNLSNLYGDDIELDVYIGSHDYIGVFINGTLQEYCDRNNIPYEI